MDDGLSKRVALVTGASFGIGEAIAKALCAQGIQVVGCARNIQKLNQLEHEIKESNASGGFKPVKCDLRSENDILAVFGTISEQFGRLDIVVNNAGLSKNAPLTTGSTEDWKEMIDVNVLALSICTREALKIMFEKNIDDGHIINISSMSGHRVVNSPSTHFYSGTKFMVKALGEGIRYELRARKSHIRVTTISPGMTETEFAVGLFGQKKAQEMYNSMNCIKASDIAELVVNTLKMGKHVDVNDILVRPVEQIL